MAGMLEGKHVTLRRVEPRDHEAIQRWQNEPTVFRWMDYVRPFSLADIKESEERAAQEGHPFTSANPCDPKGQIAMFIREAMFAIVM